MGDSAASGPQNSVDGPELKPIPTLCQKKVHKHKNITPDIKIIVNPIHYVAQW